jgi:ABC-type lipoprotein export system ATPase subunit
MSEALEFIAEALCVSGPGGVMVNDLSVTVHRGEVVGITGPSGSGKTTLLHVLGGLAAPDSGRLLLGGRPVAPWRDAAVAIVLQSLQLLAILTAHEAVGLPLQARGLTRAEVGERADRALAALGLEEHSRQLTGELSGGQRQRVAIARALAGTPDLILADEPTSALDAHWRSVVLDQLSDAARGGAMVILASGDPELIRRCDQVIRLGMGDDGLEPPTSSV